MMKIQPKPLRWLGDSLDTVKAFSAEAKKSAGHQLGLVQAGLDPIDWKSMEIVGPGTKEIRIRAETGYRVLYVAKFVDAVYVLHAFVKKTTKTGKQDIALATERYKALMKLRNAK
jgi:phage-related protein